MNTLLRRRAMIASGGGSPTPPTPVGVPVEYIQTSGDQYFDTGVLASNDLDFELDIEITFSGGSACVFGARNRNQSQSQANQYNSLSVYVNGSGYLALNDKNYDSGYQTGKPSVLNSRHTIKIISRELFVDNTSYVASGITTTYDYNASVGLLRMHGLDDTWQGGTNRGISAKVYGFKIYKAGTLIRYFKPYRDGDNIGFIYDSITGTSINNVGSGSVTPGPDINNT